MTNPWVWVPASDVAPYPGWSDSGPQPTLLALNLPAGATVPLPGPPAGFVRSYDTAAFASTVLASPMTATTIVLQPLGWLASAVLSTAAGNAFARLPMLQAGESFDIINAGANPGRVGITYTDFPAAGYGFTRLQLSAVAQDAIPAPASGFNRPVPRRFANTVTSISVEPAWLVLNVDTVAHVLDLLSNGNIIGRSASIAAGGAAQTPTGAQLAYASPSLGPIQVRLQAAPTTTAPRFYATYRASAT